MISDGAREHELIGSEAAFVAITRLDPALAAEAHSARKAEPPAGELHRDVLAGEAAAE